MGEGVVVPFGTVHSRSSSNGLPPEYTPEALEAKLEGSVHLSAMIGIDGVPSDIKVTKSLGKGLDEKAIECFKKWRFSPAIRNGEPTPMSSEVAIIFKLPDSK
jgi:protein TonB